MAPYQPPASKRRALTRYAVGAQRSLRASLNGSRAAPRLSVRERFTRRRESNSLPPPRATSATPATPVSVIPKRLHRVVSQSDALALSNTPSFLQGIVRITWYLRIKVSRLLALKGRTLTCTDVRGVNELWSIMLDGARVRIHLHSCSITLSKLGTGAPIQFWPPDEESTRRWASSLLKASALIAMDDRRWA